ncbi:hypothetical protein BMS81_04255, partial [Leuconostoc pseudomesenteroides]
MTASLSAAGDKKICRNCKRLTYQSHFMAAQIISQIESETTLETNNVSVSPDIVVRETTEQQY